MVAPVRLGEAFAPLSERHFRLLWLGRASSAAGDALMPLAVAFAVLSVNGSATALGAVLAAFWISRVAFTLVGGVVSDRLPRRAVMLACDGCARLHRGVHGDDAPDAPDDAADLHRHGGALRHCVGVLRACRRTASCRRRSAPRKLQPANALLGITNNVMNVFGPAVAGILIVFTAPGLGLRDRLGQLPRERLVPDAAADPGARAPAAQHVRARAARRAARGDVAAVGACADHRLRDHELLLRRVHRARPGDLRATHLGGARDWAIVSTCGAFGAIVGGLASVRLHPRTAAVVRLRRLGARRCCRSPRSPARCRSPRSPLRGASAWRRSRSATPTGRRTCSGASPRGVFARVRSYDILVSFVFMPLGFIAFPLIARSLGDARTLLVGRDRRRGHEPRRGAPSRACARSRTSRRSRSRVPLQPNPARRQRRARFSRAPSSAYALAGVRFLFGM